MNKRYLKLISSILAICVAATMLTPAVFADGTMQSVGVTSVYEMDLSSTPAPFAAGANSYTTPQVLTTTVVAEAGKMVKVSSSAVDNTAGSYHGALDMPMGNGTDYVDTVHGCSNSVDISYDLVPAYDSTKTTTRSTLVIAGNDNKLKNYIIFELGNDGTTRKLHYGGEQYSPPNDKRDLAIVDLTTKLGYAPPADHVYRIRMLWKPYDEKSDGQTLPYLQSWSNSAKTYTISGVMQIYVDGVSVVENIPYVHTSGRTKIKALWMAHTTHGGETADNVTTYPLGTIGNVKLVTYGKTSEVEDLQVAADKLLVAIRKAETEGIISEAKINTAKAVYTNRATKTKTELETAITDMQTADPEPEQDPVLSPVTCFVNNDFENLTENEFPFTEATVDTAADNTPLIGSAMKLDATSEEIKLTSDFFERTDVTGSGGWAKHERAVIEFDLKMAESTSTDPTKGFGLECHMNNEYDDYGQTEQGSHYGNQEALTILNFYKEGIIQEAKEKKDYSGLENGNWNRIKIVLKRTASGAASACTDIYVNGVLVGENVARSTTTTQKSKYFDQFKMIVPVGEIVYVDNLKIYKLTDDIPEPPALDELVYNIRKLNALKSVMESNLGTNKGQYAQEDCVTVENAITEAAAFAADIETNGGKQGEINAKTAEIKTLLAETKPVGDNVEIKAVTPTGNLASDTVTMATSIKTSVNAESTTDVALLCVLYADDGTVLGMAKDTAEISRNSTGDLSADLNLESLGLESREGIYLKSYVLSGDSFDNILDVPESGALGSEPAAEYSVGGGVYSETAQIYKTENSETSMAGILVEGKAKANEKLFVYTLTGNVASAATLKTATTAQEVYDYVNMISADAEGKFSFEFTPGTVGNCRLVIISADSSEKLFDKNCYADTKTEVSDAISKLKAETVDIDTVADKLNLKTAIYDSAKAQGVLLGKVAAYVLNPQSRTRAVGTMSAYDFKSGFMKYTNLLNSVVTASGADVVTLALNDAGFSIPGDSNKQSKICTYIYDSRATALTVEAVETMLTYEPPTTGGTDPPGGGGGGGGGFTAVAGTGKVESRADELQTEPLPVDKAQDVFNDLSGYDWAKEAITFMQKKGAINGKGDGRFDPAGKITREEFVKIAVNMFEISGDNTNIAEFTDVKADGWYYPFVAKAVSSGLVLGIDENSFGIGQQISRQDAIVILYRAANMNNAEFSDDAVYIPFADDCADYAAEAVEMLAKSNIVKGSDNMLRAYDSLTRAEASKLIYELYLFLYN